MVTLATPIRDTPMLMDPNCVKVVTDENNRALYFGRSVVPYPRVWSDELLKTGQYLRHLGIYAYRWIFLIELSEMPMGRLERIERLEQLRALEVGCTILVGEVDESSIGIDTAEDYQRFVERQKERIENE